MAGKTTTTSLNYAFKKLQGKANTSNLKSDSQETIGTNIQVGATTVFGVPLPSSPTQTLYTVQSDCIEYVVFDVSQISGTTYDANDPGGGGDGAQNPGPHGYALALTGSYEASTDNAKAGTFPFTDGQVLSGSAGALQIVPGFFSTDSPNPYTIALYESDGAGGIGDQIPLLDEVDWTIDTFNGVLFLQDYDSTKIPAYAKGFVYTGDMMSSLTGSGGGGPGDKNAEFVLTKATGSLPNAKIIEAGPGITLITGSNSITVSSTSVSVNGRDKNYYILTSSVTSGTAFDTTFSDFSSVSYQPNLIDVLVNGQLLHSGTAVQVSASSVDYTVFTSGSLKFAFGLLEEDIIDVIISQLDSGAGSSGDPGAQYLVLAATSSLSAERVMTAGTGISHVDSGPGNPYTLSIDDSVTATISGSTFTGAVNFNQGLSGSLTHLIDGSSYIIAGSSITVTSGSSGAITIASTAAVNRSKFVYELTSSHPANEDLGLPTVNFSSVSYSKEKIDIFVNGQLMTSGSSNDYLIPGALTGSVNFSFALSDDDIVAALLY